MNPLLLYLLLLKATLTSFTGLASIPVIRADFVTNRHVLTDAQLNTAIVISRSTPGPNGVYVVSIGYAVGGVTGAVAGWAAMCTPALLIVPFLRVAERQATHRRMRGATHAVISASAGLMLAAAVPLGVGTLTDTFTILIAIAGTVLMFRNVSAVWLVAGSALLGLIAAFFA